MIKDLEAIKPIIFKMLKFFYNERLGDKDYNEQMENAKVMLHSLAKSALDRYGIKGSDYGTDILDSSNISEGSNTFIHFVDEPGSYIGSAGEAKRSDFPDNPFLILIINTYYLENGYAMPNGTHLDWYKNESPHERVKACCQYISNIFHETRHIVQRVLAKSKISNKKTLLYAKEIMLAEKQKKDFYEKNYEFTTMEAESMEEDSRMMLELAEALGDIEFIRIVQDRREQHRNDIYSHIANFAKLRFGESSNEYKERRFLINELSDECIKINPQYIARYPVLRKRI
jgi:hypothetical protein